MAGMLSSPELRGRPIFLATANRFGRRTGPRTRRAAAQRTTGATGFLKGRSPGREEPLASTVRGEHGGEKTWLRWFRKGPDLPVGYRPQAREMVVPLPRSAIACLTRAGVDGFMACAHRRSDCHDPARPPDVIADERVSQGQPGTPDQEGRGRECAHLPRGLGHKKPITKLALPRGEGVCFARWPRDECLGPASTPRAYPAKAGLQRSLLFRGGPLQRMFLRRFGGAFRCRFWLEFEP